MKIREIPSAIGRLFGRGISRVRRIFERMPSAEDCAQAAAQTTAALLRVGDRIGALEPEHFRVLGTVERLVRGAEVANGLLGSGRGTGADKLAAVRLGLTSAWGTLRMADDAFDATWYGLVRPFIVDLVALAKGEDPDVAQARERERLALEAQP